MLSNVSVSVAMRMLREVDKDVPLLVRHSTALPRRVAVAAKINRVRLKSIGLKEPANVASVTLQTL